MPTPAAPAPICPRCSKPMKPHCQRTTPKNGNPKAKPCGWATCIKPECHTVMRIRDQRILPIESGSSK